MRVDTSDVPALRTGLETLSELLEHARFRLPFPGRDAHEADRSDLARTIREYLLPRLRDPEAPVVASILGETGVGKSLITNTLAQDRISEPGVLRPTTTSPVLWAHRDHAGRYWSEFVARVRERVGPALEVVIGDDPLTSNLTIIDTPPLDYVSSEGTLAAREVLQLSDLCVFVTSVSRYADAAGWEFLHEARRRGTPVLFVFNRLPSDRAAASALLTDYARRLYEDDLLLDPDPSMLFGVAEGSIERWHGGLPPAAVGGLRKELGELADPDFRQGLVEQTTYSSVLALTSRAEALEEAFRREQEAADRLVAAVNGAYEGSARRLRDELAEGGFASLAERTLWAQAAVDLTGIVTRRAGVAAQEAATQWAAEPTGERFLSEGGHGLWRHGHDTTYETQRLLDEWADEIQEAGVRRSRAGWYRRSVRKKLVEQLWPMVVTGQTDPDRWMTRHFGDEARPMLRDASMRLAHALEQALMVDAARFTNFLGDSSPLQNLDKRIADQVASIVALAESTGEDDMVEADVDGAVGQAGEAPTASADVTSISPAPELTSWRRDIEERMDGEESTEDEAPSAVGGPIGEPEETPSSAAADDAPGYAFGGGTRPGEPSAEETATSDGVADNGDPMAGDHDPSHGDVSPSDGDADPIPEENTDMGPDPTAESPSHYERSSRSDFELEGGTGDA